MSKSTKKSRVQNNVFFLDTTAVNHLLYSSAECREAVLKVIGDSRHEISRFVRMESFRGFINILINTYFAVKNSPTVQGALEYLSHDYHPRRMKVVVKTASFWLDMYDFESVAKVATLQRLGHFIVECAHRFDDEFHSRYCRKKLDCELGKLAFPNGAFDEDGIFNFIEEFNRIDKNPECDLCEFREAQRRNLQRNGIELYSEKQRERFKKTKYKGYTAQAEHLAVIDSISDELPHNCNWCKKVGDSIIALECPKKSTLVAIDQSFGPLCEILGKSNVSLPSHVALHRNSNK